MTVRVPLLPRWVRWTAVLGLAAFIFYTSILTTPPATVIDDLRFELLPLDKWRHFLAYGAFGGALAYATTDWDADARTLAAAVIGVTVLYGIGIELGQSQIPNRYFSLGDAYANALGAAFVVPYYLLRSRLSFAPVTAFVGSE